MTSDFPFATSDCPRLRFCQLTDTVRYKFFTLYCIGLVASQNA